MIKKAERVELLVNLASKLDKMGLHSLASKVDATLQKEATDIELILNIYTELHTVTAALPTAIKKNIFAVLRKDDRPDVPTCPFGLPIPRACEFVGDTVNEMATRKVEHKHNRRIYNAKRTHQHCPFALQILKSKNAVQCSQGTINAGIPAFEEFSGSPYYPKMRQAFNIPDPLVQNSNYYTYHDFHYYSLY